MPKSCLFEDFDVVGKGFGLFSLHYKSEVAGVIGFGAEMDEFHGS